MAAHGRPPLPLPLLLLSACLYGCVAVRGFKVSSGPAEPPNPPAVRTVDLPAKEEAAAQPRRASGWKLAEEEACREDLSRLCPKHTWTNNLAVLECLQDRREVSGQRRTEGCVRAGGQSLNGGQSAGCRRRLPIPTCWGG